MLEQQFEAWWPWEQKAYWIDGATWLAILLDDKALLAKACRPIEYTLSHPDMEGYLGPELFQDPLAITTAGRTMCFSEAWQPPRTRRLH